MSGPRRLDQVLLERGLVDPDAAVRARELQQERGGTLLGAFQSLGGVDEDQLAEAAAEASGFPRAGEIRPGFSAETITEIVFSAMIGASVRYGIDKSQADLNRTIGAIIRYLRGLTRTAETGKEK